jgi:hypothetical protein
MGLGDNCGSDNYRQINIQMVFDKKSRLSRLYHIRSGYPEIGLLHKPYSGVNDSIEPFRLIFYIHQKYNAFQIG